MDKNEFEFILSDRIQKIKQIINKYGIENFYISYSGGMDSTVLSRLIDIAIPDNEIPRVYIDTGMDYNYIRKYVKDIAAYDPRYIILLPEKNIKETLESEGYPFKSKEHSMYLSIYQNRGISKSYYRYLYPDESRKGFGCPEKLKYQFTPDFNIKISDHCCYRMKERPLEIWAKKNNKPYSILGIMRSEGGQRKTTQCLRFLNGNFKSFHPLSVISKEWEKEFIFKFNIKLCELYYPPFNFKRTGCKGCPFNLYLQRDLDTLEKYLPEEKRQCEIIWKPIYQEYRRIGYRLRGSDCGAGAATKNND